MFKSVLSAGLFASVLVLNACGSGDGGLSGLEGRNHRTMSVAEVRGVLAAAEFRSDEIPVMTCIAYAESTFDPGEMSGVGARGLFQIMPDHVDQTDNAGNVIQRGDLCPGIRDYELWEPTANARCALKVYLAQGFQAWDPYYFAQAGHYSWLHSHNYLDCMDGKMRMGFVAGN